MLCSDTRHSGSSHHLRVKSLTVGSTISGAAMIIQ